MLSLYTAMARRNEHAKFKSMRVYGLLTDLRDFYFYSYDQSQREFTFDETVKVRSFRGDREVFMADMIRGMSRWLSHFGFKFLKVKIFFFHSDK